MSGEQSITERLASLEVWADARTKEFQKLKESFSKLQRENLDMKKENIGMKNENIDMKTDLFHLREEHEKLVELNANLTAKVHLLGSKVADSFGQDGCTSSPVERKLEGLETTVGRLVNDNPVMQANKQKIKKLARKIKVMGKTVKQLSTLRKVLGRTMMAARGGPSQQVDAKVDALETRTLAIEGKLGGRPRDQDPGNRGKAR